MARSSGIQGPPSLRCSFRSPGRVPSFWAGRSKSLAICRSSEYSINQCDELGPRSPERIRRSAASESEEVRTSFSADPASGRHTDGRPLADLRRRMGDSVDNCEDNNGMATFQTKTRWRSMRTRCASGSRIVLIDSGDARLSRFSPMKRPAFEAHFAFEPCWKSLYPHVTPAFWRLVCPTAKALTPMR